jgi:hypothetical protein
MRFIIYDFPAPTNRSVEFERDLYEACCELCGRYSSITHGNLVIDVKKRTLAPTTMIVICKKSRQRQILSDGEVMLTLEIAALIEDLTLKHGIASLETEPVTKIH